MPQTAPALYSAGRFNLGGRVYLRDERIRDEDVKTLSEDEVAFYKRRGILTPDAPRKGSNLARIATAPVAPMTTEDAPNKPAQPTHAPPSEQEPLSPATDSRPLEEQRPVEPPPDTPNPVLDAAAQLAERQRLAAERITSGKKGK